jgi:hypothetical protein
MMMSKEKVRLCENCKTGRKTYEIDNHSEFCNYIVCYEDGNCPFFRPINPMGYTRKKTFLEQIINFLKR